MNAYLVCSGILVLVYSALSLYVSLMRGRLKIGIGPGPDLSGPLNKAVRAHGNSAEYTPLFVALFLYFLMAGASGWITWAVIGITLCRVLHPIGMLLSPDFNRPPHALRAIGALGTYVGGALLGVALLMRATL
jgi:uncharacterized membrane protein YecN with MAPEG domain